MGVFFLCSFGVSVLSLSIWRSCAHNFVRMASNFKPIKNTPISKPSQKPIKTNTHNSASITLRKGQSPIVTLSRFTATNAAIKPTALNASISPMKRLIGRPIKCCIRCEALRMLRFIQPFAHSLTHFEIRRTFCFDIHSFTRFGVACDSRLSLSD